MKINKEWNADPNVPNPQIDIFECNLLLSFNMNSYQYNKYNDGDIGFIVFKDVMKYRLGSPNDEGFYRGQFRYDKSQIKWGEFYKIEDSKYNVNFPHDPIIINKHLIGKDNLIHYLFFFRDNTFECIAKEHVLFVEKDFIAYCPYCASKLIYNGRNFIGEQCKVEYSVKMTQSLLLEIELSNLTDEDNRLVRNLSEFYCPKCSKKLYYNTTDGLVCLECGVHFSRSQIHHLIELNPHI